MPKFYFRYKFAQIDVYFFFFRVLSLLGIALWLYLLKESFVFPFSSWGLLALFTLHLLIFLWISKRKFYRDFSLYLWTLVFDVLVITGLVWFTGDKDSAFQLLYYLPTTFASYYLGLLIGIILAFLSSVGYFLVITEFLVQPFPLNNLELLSFLWIFVLVSGVVSEKMRTTESRFVRTLDILNQRTAELEKSQAQLETAYETTRTLGESYNINQIIDEVLNIAKEILGYQMASVLLLSDDKRSLLLRGFVEKGKKNILPKPEVISLAGITGVVAKSGRPERVPDVMLDLRYIPGLKNARSEMALPMISRGRILGVLNAESQEVDAFSPQDQKIFTVLANSTALAIDNAILYQKTEELTIVDELTGAFNYRYFTQKLADEIRRATRYAQTLSLIMVDIDWFKKCNDSYGHPFGNLVLKSLSDLIRHSIRDVDMLFRYGGEEFMVILPQTDKEQAKTIAERIRSQVERSEFVDPEKNFRSKITVSVGIACFPEDGKTQPDLIGRVDHALYQAKGWGKNLVSTV